MLQLENFEEHNITGRGKVFSGKFPASHPLPEISERVMINGKEYTVVGIESSVLLVHPPRRSENIGIIVR